MASGLVPGRSPGRDPDAEERDYSDRFTTLATAIESCRNAEDVALLLSTCRNEWLTANAVFVDLKLAIGLDGQESRLSAGIAALRRRDVDAAKRPVERGIRALAQGSEKLEVWARREDLLGQLRAAIEKLDQGPQWDANAYLDEQQHLRGKIAGRADGEYVSLSLNETQAGQDLLKTLRRFRAKAAVIGFALNEIIKLWIEIVRPRDLFDDNNADPWAQMVGHLTEQRDGAKSAAEDLGVDFLDRGTPEREQDELAERLLTSLHEQLESLRAAVLSKLRPNFASRPLPSPYELDVIASTGGSPVARQDLIVEIGRGRVRETEPDDPRVALVSMSIPDGQYEDSGRFYHYREDRIEHAQALVEAAIARAAELDVKAVVFPECSVPAAMANELDERAEKTGLTIVAGLDHQMLNHGKVRNEVLICAPHEPPLSQLKQRPSVYEPRNPHFDSDSRLHVKTGTHLGTMAVAVCSDYLELDLVFRLANAEESLDTLIVCARNPNPQVFARLAAADAARLMANIVVVNNSPVAPVEDDCLVEAPYRDGSRVQSLSSETLQTDGWPDALAEVTVTQLPLRSARSRFKGRTDPSVLHAPSFAART